MRAHGLCGGGFSVTVGGGGSSVGTGCGGLGGGGVASPGGTGNFQPSVVSARVSLPSGRTQGASASSRPSRAATVSATATGVLSTGYSGLGGSSGRTVGDPHL